MLECVESGIQVVSSGSGQIVVHESLLSSQIWKEEVSVCIGDSWMWV